MTSSDVLDTSLAMILRDAADLILAGIDQVREAVIRRAPSSTSGLRDRPLARHPRRADDLRLEAADLGRRAGARAARAGSARGETIAVGKISGAVGTFAHLSPAIEEQAMACWACRRRPVSDADRPARPPRRVLHARWRCAGASIEKFAVEIRHLQRTEVREVEEPFGKGQKGSLGHAAQAQPDPLREPDAGWPGCCAATRCRRSRTCRSGTSATSATPASSG